MSAAVFQAMTAEKKMTSKYAVMDRRSMLQLVPITLLVAITGGIPLKSSAELSPTEMEEYQRLLKQVCLLR